MLKTIDFSKHPIVEAGIVKAHVMKHWAYNPEDFTMDLFGATMEEYQGEMSKVLVPDSGIDRVAMKSAHGVGKTSGLAFVGWNFLITRPIARVVATAPTKAQLTDALWPEYGKWWSKMRLPQLQDLFYISEGHIRCKLNPKAWFAVGRTSNRPENLQGFHADHVLVQVDEASGVEEPVFETMEGILSNAERDGDECLLMLTGNPNFNAGEMFNAFNKNRELYHRITVSGDKATRFTERDGICFISPRVTEKMRKVYETKNGLDSAVYDVRVRGQFPRYEDDAIIPLAYAEQCVGLPLPPFDPVKHPWTLVMDVSRSGMAKTTLFYFRRGHLVLGKYWTGKITAGEIEDAVLDAIKEIEGPKSEGGWGEKYDRLIVDEPGIGGPIIDQLRRAGIVVQPYNGGISMQRGVDPDEQVRRFLNRRVRDYWNLRLLCEKRQISLPRTLIDARRGVEVDSEELTNEMASVHYGYQMSTDKLKCESKPEMCDRLGKAASPDLCDTVVMGACQWFNSTHGALADILDMNETIDDFAEPDNDRALVECIQDMEDGLW